MFPTWGDFYFLKTFKRGLLQNPMFCRPLFFCTCGTPIKSDLSDMSDMSDQVPHRTLMQDQSVYQY